MLKVLLRWCKNFNSTKEGAQASHPQHWAFSYTSALSLTSLTPCKWYKDLFFHAFMSLPWGLSPGLRWDSSVHRRGSRLVVQTKAELLSFPLLLSRHSNWASSPHLEIKNYKWKGPILTKCLCSYYTWYPHQNVNHNNPEQPCGASTGFWYMALFGRSERQTNIIHSFPAAMEM